MGLARDYATQASFIPYVRPQAGGEVFETDIYTHFALLLSGKYDDQKKLASRSNTVITFNFDLIVDDALSRVGAKPGYELADAVYPEVMPREGLPTIPPYSGHCEKSRVLFISSIDYTYQEPL
jgi:hypothetical protein